MEAIVYTFLLQMDAIVIIILQIFFTKLAVLIIASIWRENMLGYLSADIICSEKRKVFQKRRSRKTVSFEEQIMSKDKYPSIFRPKWRLSCLLSFKSFSQRGQFWKLRDILGYYPVLAGEY